MFLKEKIYTYHFVKYTIVGGANIIVIFGLFFFFNDILKTDPILANRVGYAGGLIFNFTLNKIWTFKSGHFRPLEIILFLFSFAVSYMIQFFIFRLLMDVVGWNEGVATILANPIYGLAFFFQCKYVAFNPALTRKNIVKTDENGDALKVG